MLSLQQPNQNLPTGKAFAFLLIGLFIIGITILTIQNSRDAIQHDSDEEKLQVLDTKYRGGKELTESEFKKYCELLEKIWKKHLPACYCKDGIENQTSGIDWTNPPKSPEDLSSDWTETTHPRQKKNSNTRTFVNIRTKQRIAFDKGEKGLEGHRGEDHWHRFNSEKDEKDKLDFYLDECGKPVDKWSRSAHIKPKGLSKYDK
jgi:hypothetical protein